MLGYSSAELARIRYIDVVHPDEVEAARAFTSVGPGTRRAVDRRFVHRDGTTVLGRVTVTVAPDESFRIAVIEDITEKANIERQQQEAQRLEAIGRLAGGIAHDFNNLLTGVVGHAELIRTASSPAEVEQSVEVILDASFRAAELVSQLLTFSRQNEFRAEEIETADLLQRTAKLLRRILGSAVQVEVDIHEGAPRIVADPSQIDQMLLNLAVNARDAMPDGGILSLSVGPFRLDESDRRYAAATPGDYCRIVVADTGIGMSDGTISRIFEPFFTTKDVGKGTGLGLATTHGIVTRARGHLLVSSALGEGTTFEILLPALQAQSEPTQEPLLLAS
jgi:signal transduction histidine kinase